MGEARNESLPHRIDRPHEDDRHDRGGLLGGAGGGPSGSHHDVDLESNELLRETHELIEVSFTEPVFDRNVLPLDVTALPQPPLEGLDEAPGRLTGPQEPYRVDLHRRLRFGGDGSGEECEGEERDGQTRHLSTSRWPGCYAGRCRGVNERLRHPGGDARGTRAGDPVVLLRNFRSGP